MEKMWAGRTSGKTNSAADAFNSSIGFDSRMFSEDITGSMAHAAMLGAQGIISGDEAEALIAGLREILADIESGKLTVDMGCEDIHMFIEQVLTSRIGDVGKKLHTARSRNDQVALDLRMYLRGQIDLITQKIKEFLGVIAQKAEEYSGVIMPGYTHLQRAQPILFSHQLLAYGMMLARDTERFADCRKRVNISPIGCCALAGTTYDTDRFFEAARLGFDGVCRNSLDGVSDRDFVIETLSCISTLMMHLSRFSEEVILWSSWEFGFVELSDEFTTGSSIMPQKKNSDMAELVRGKTGRVYGDLMALLTTMKGLPLAYNKDMQEDKECVFDACDTVLACLDIFTGMIATMSAKPEKMLAAAKKGFINATDLADYLVGKGLPFRTAYKVSGQLVAKCISLGFALDDLPLDEYKQACELIDEGVFEAIKLENCVARRKSYGGTSPESVKEQIDYLKSIL